MRIHTKKSGYAGIIYEYVPMVCEEVVLHSYDNIGPEAIVRIKEKDSGSVRAIWVKDNSNLGLPCVGGTFYRDLPPEEIENICLEKARWMSLKSALVHCSGDYPLFGRKNEPLRWGGSKIGIAGDPKSPEKHAIIRGVALALFEAGIVPQEHLIGIDEGTNESDSAEIIKFLGSPRYVAGCGKEFGGVPFDELGITGMAAAEGVAETLGLLGIPLNKPNVAVQGFGAVGRAFIKHAIELGMRINAVSDLRIKLEGLPDCRCVWQPFGSLKFEYFETDQEDYIYYPYDACIYIPGDIRFAHCDILVLAATGNVITTETEATQVKARIIAEPANFPTTKPVQEYFHRAGKIVIPGPALNAGGVIAAYAEQVLWDRMSADEKIKVAKHEAVYSVRTVTRKILENSFATNRPPFAVVEEMAMERLKSFQKTK